MIASPTPDFCEVDLAALPPGEAVADLIGQAARMDASDLYFLSDEDGMTIAVRRLGIVQRIAFVSVDVGVHYISHVKALADMDITERRQNSG